MTSRITVRLSEKERKALAKHGKISDVVRDALRFYLREKDTRRVISHLRELQKSPIRSTIQDDLQLIRADRNR